MFQLPENGTCKLKKTVHEPSKAYPLKCFKCGEQGHITEFKKAKNLRKNLQVKAGEPLRGLAKFR